jgi:hypothetical protein
MPDYVSMRTHIVRAEAETKKAIEALHPIDKITQLEAYVLGHMRGVQALLEKARDAIDQTHALKRRIQTAPAPSEEPLDGV